MNCREYQHQITLLLYEELRENERPELETHLHQCESCKHFYEEEKGLHFVLAEDAAATWDVPADLLVESRRALANELDRVERKRAWWRVPTFSVVLTPMRMLESAALVAMGLALGVYVNQQQAPQVVSTPQQAATSLIPRNAALSNLRIVKSDPATGDVELAGEVVQPLRFQGTMQDDTVRRLLMSALRDASNPTSRVRAAEVLAQNTSDEMVEQALIDALVYDENANVRLQALQALQRFAGEEHVRAAFMHTLSNDDNADLRVKAIEALTTYSGDSETAQSIRELTEQEENPYVRMKALQFVGGTK
jgi:HEAT repeat protein